MIQTGDDKQYTVLSIQRSSRVLLNNTFSKVVVISYRLNARGYVGELAIPEDQADPDNVKKLIEADISKVEALYKL